MGRRNPLIGFACLTITIWGMAQARPFLVPLCIAGLLAFLLNPIIRLLRRAHVPESLALGASFLMLLLPLCGVAYVLAFESQSLSANIPLIAASISNSWQSLYLDFQSKVWAHKLGLPSFGSSGAIFIETRQWLHFLVSSVETIISMSSQAALILLFTVLMLLSRQHLRVSAEKILGLPHAAHVLDEVTLLIERFLVSRLLIVGIVTLADSAILTALHIEYAFLLGLILGGLTVLPGIGFALSLLPCVLVAVATQKTFMEILFMLSALCVMSLIESNILTPRIAGRQVKISALATFVGMLGGVLLWGVWGMLLSVPALGILRIAFSQVPSLKPWSELLSSDPNPTSAAIPKLAPLESTAKTEDAA